MKPTERQKVWLAEVFGPEVWLELTRQPEFRAALESSVEQCRRLALRHLAQRERRPPAVWVDHRAAA